MQHHQRQSSCWFPVTLPDRLGTDAPDYNCSREGHHFSLRRSGGLERRNFTEARRDCRAMTTWPPNDDVAADRS